MEHFQERYKNIFFKVVFIISTLLGLKIIVVPRLSPFGFEYTGKLDSISWVFERQAELLGSSFQLLGKARL